MTLTAVRGVASVGGHKGGVGGVNVVDRGGTNHWAQRRAEDGASASKHSYLVLEGDKNGKLMEADIAAGRPAPILGEMHDEINRLLCRKPEPAAS